MRPPRFAADHPDHGLECEGALEPYLLNIIERASDEGWAHEAIWPALRSLIANLEQAEIENRRTGQAIREARLAKPD